MVECTCRESSLFSRALPSAAVLGNHAAGAVLEQLRRSLLVALCFSWLAAGCAWCRLPENAASGKWGAQLQVCNGGVLEVSLFPYSHPAVCRRNRQAARAVHAASVAFFLCGKSATLLSGCQLNPFMCVFRRLLITRLGPDLWTFFPDSLIFFDVSAVIL